MFWFFKKKPIDIHFFTTREEVFNLAKPKHAIEFIPDWFKKLPAHKFTNEPNQNLIGNRNIKTCPGFVNLYKTGFIFSLWSDLNVEINGDDYRYQFIDHASNIVAHNANQMGNCPINSNYKSLQLLNPWMFKVDKKVNLLFSAPTWNNFGYDNIVVAPGMFSPHFGIMNANINLFFKKKPELTIYEIPHGEPLVHIFPLSDQPIKMHYELITKEEEHRIKAKNPIFLMDKNRFKRAEKLCPHE